MPCSRFASVCFEHLFDLAVRTVDAFAGLPAGAAVPDASAAIIGVGVCAIAASAISIAAPMAAFLYFWSSPDKPSA